MRFDPNNIEEVKKALKSTGSNIKFVSKPSNDLCFLALKNGATLNDIKSPTYPVICYYLEHLCRTQTLRFFYQDFPFLINKKILIYCSKQLYTYKQLSKLINKVSDNPIYITSINNVVNFLIDAFYYDRHLIDDILECSFKVITDIQFNIGSLEPIITYAIENNMNVPDEIIINFPRLIKTDEQIQLAVGNSKNIPIIDFSKLSEKTIQVLLKADTLKYIRMIEQTEERCLLAVKSNLKALKFIDNPSKQVVEYCLKKNIKSYYYIENPSEEATRLFNVMSILV
jgi:hypothetical protein